MNSRDRRSNKTIVDGAPTFGEGEKGTAGYGKDKTTQRKKKKDKWDLTVGKTSVKGQKI